MIELKRLKLINWHNFENTTFDLSLIHIYRFITHAPQ